MRPYYNYDSRQGGPGGVRISFGFGWTKTIKVLVIVNALMYLVSLILLKNDIDVFRWLGFSRTLFLKGAAWQLVTYMFLHGSLRHLFFNMLGLFFFGGQVERALGLRSFVVMYFLCGVVGALLSLIDPNALLVIGASGGVFGVLIAFAMLFPNKRVLVFLIFPVKARYLAIFLCFITSASLLAGKSDGIAHWAHLGGIAVGFLFGRFAAGVGRAFDVLGELRRFWRARRKLTRERRSAGEQAELDRILEKVHRVGIMALSNKERDFLNAMSRKYKDDG